MVIKQNVPHGMDDPGLRRKDIVMIKLQIGRASCRERVYHCV